jgi:hypothetical protein
VGLYLLTIRIAFINPSPLEPRSTALHLAEQAIVSQSSFLEFLTVSALLSITGIKVEGRGGKPGLFWAEGRMDNMKPTASTLAQANPDHPKLTDLGVKEGESITSQQYIYLGLVNLHLEMIWLEGG